MNMSHVHLHSVRFAVLGIICGLVLTYFFRHEKRKLFAAYCGGLAVSFADFWGAFFAHRLDLWHLHGAWEVFGVPLSLNVAWVFLGAGYCLLFSLTDNMKHSFPAKLLFAAGTCLYGVFNDYIFSRLGIFRLGDGIKLYYTFPYWVIHVLLTVLVFYAVRKKFSKKEPGCSQNRPNGGSTIRQSVC